LTLDRRAVHIQLLFVFIATKAQPAQVIHCSRWSSDLTHC